MRERSSFLDQRIRIKREGGKKQPTRPLQVKKKKKKQQKKTPRVEHFGSPGPSSVNAQSISTGVTKRAAAFYDTHSTENRRWPSNTPTVLSIHSFKKKVSLPHQSCSAQPGKNNHVAGASGPAGARCAHGGNKNETLMRPHSSELLKTLCLSPVSSPITTDSAVRINN